MIHTPCAINARDCIHAYSMHSTCEFCIIVQEHKQFNNMNYHRLFYQVTFPRVSIKKGKNSQIFSTHRYPGYIFMCFPSNFFPWTANKKLLNSHYFPQMYFSYAYFDIRQHPPARSLLVADHKTFLPLEITTLPDVPRPPFAITYELAITHDPAQQTSRSTM